MALFKKISNLFKPNADGEQKQEGSVILRDESSPQDSRYLEAILYTEGRLTIHGVDRGTEVARIWGDSEYEWGWTIRAENLPALEAALQAENNLLHVLEMNFSGDNAANLASFLDQHDIIYEFWSRLGE